MKKLLFLFVILHVFFSCKGQSTGHKTLFDNGRVKETYYLDKNGQLTGEANIYFDNGKLSTISTYKNGKKIGESKWYWKNGKLRGSVSFTENEKMSGEWKEYHENGQLANNGNYENGEKTGSWNYYFDNGQLTTLGNMKTGIVLVNGNCIIKTEPIEEWNNMTKTDVKLVSGKNITKMDNWKALVVMKQE